MTAKRLSQLLLGLLAAATLLVAPACNSTMGEKDVKEMSQKAAELDKLNQQATQAGTEEARKLAEAGVKDVAPNPATLQLTPEQRTALEARIKVEKNSSYQALLQEVLDKDKEIKGLNERIASLRAVLPRPEIAKAGDSHYDMAVHFLRRRGLSEAKAKAIVDKTYTMDQLVAGFQVYHFYSNGVYGTWVSQGKADITPTQLIADAKAKLTGERDAAEQQAKDLQTKIADLNAEAAKVSADLENLKTERAKMTEELKTITAASQAQLAMLNSVHYLVGNRKNLEKDGVIVIPVFAKDRAGENWNDQAFTKAADLRTQDTIVIDAKDAGLEKIGKVNVVPGSLEKDKHYTLTYNDDRSQATVKILAKDRFRNEKVAFALTD